MGMGAGRIRNAEDLGEAFAELAREAVADGPITVSRSGGEDLVVIARKQLERDYRLTPQAYVRLNKVRQEAVDLLEKAMAEARATQTGPFGI